MPERTAVPGDAASLVAPSSLESTGPATKRSRVTRQPRQPSKRAAPKSTARAASKPTVKVAGDKNPTTQPKAKPQARTKAKTKPKNSGAAVVEASVVRTSEILQRILAENPQDKITVEQIVSGLGATSFGTSLMVFSIPEVVPIPIPGMSAVVALPTGLISAQMIAGSGEIKLPKALLKRAIPRKAFEAAVKAILPFLTKAEKMVKPRWNWATSKTAKRFLGVFIFLLACAIALPVPMTNMPPAIAIFIIALGLVERDGKMIALGILLGLASFALIGGVFFGVFSLFGA